MQRDVFAPADPHAELQPIEAIEPTHALAIDDPPFPSQEDPDPQIPKAWTGMCQITNTET